MIPNAYRSLHCNAVRPEHIGQTVTLCGWVNSARDHGGVIFIDLRDREGLTQVVFRPEENADVAAQSHVLRDEDVVQIIGKVSARLSGTENSKLPTGEVEVVALELKVLNKSDVLPFHLDRELSNEDMRMKYRYLDLRRERMNKNIRTRHKITNAARNYLDGNGFVEVETPILSNPTPEGARDFLVPARLSPSKFFALPQAPQQYKQLLMVAGLERYFQIARCFRDEDLRADRQPEFTQIDIEASFIEQNDIVNLVEGLLASMFKAGQGVDIPLPFPRMTYQEAMDRYGSDKPDTRYGVEIVDMADVFAESGFKIFRSTLENGGVVRAINAKGFAGITTGQMIRLNELAIQAGMKVKQLAFIKIENGEYKSPLWKFFGEVEQKALVEKMNGEEGDIIFFYAGTWEDACNILGKVRLEIANMMNLTKDSTALNFLWVVDFPLLAFSPEDQSWVAVHHPFTRPKSEDVALLEAGEYGKVRAEAYDVVLNGYELGGGSIRIHESDLQAKMFSVLGVTPEEQELKFSHILEAFKFGAPPHGGLALGLDRIAMLVCGEDSIREVIAFPKNNKACDLMTDSPTNVDFKSLRELYIQSTWKEKKLEAATVPVTPIV
ncbi:aspartyl-tRNA synthetase [Prosthecobacter fusiformis]|uniref:Aspartate--tRNA(Asp/Asn) ligase n=1 Tax=Prosthecobacter fusiformis TaxID=48464 RepID=A0A4R7RMD8_9BACT|nr:aspartate--tRNA ligase [Prosthecobacter fusiformis]TDU64663.1 aspartyl-tRNA synthetase [Prosthecobacter fusiformis]